MKGEWREPREEEEEFFEARALRKEFLRALRFAPFPFYSLRGVRSRVRPENAHADRKSVV